MIFIFMHQRRSKDAHRANSKLNYLIHTVYIYFEIINVSTRFTQHSLHKINDEADSFLLRNVYRLLKWLLIVNPVAVTVNVRQ